MDYERNRITGICLRKLRKRAGLTQDQVAERMRCTQSAVSKIEHADRQLSLPESYFYADALGAPYDVFFKEVLASLEDAGLK